MRPLRLLVPIASALFVLLVAAPAWACGGLVNTNGSVTLVRTTTMAAYHEGIEHYVTSFEFAGGGGGVRLDHPAARRPHEGDPGRRLDAPAARAGDAAAARGSVRVRRSRRALPATAKVILKTEIDALDIVVLEGGGTAVGNWAREHGFFLPPDAPEVLDFYAERSPIFMAVRFDADRAAEQGLANGDGTPVHVVIPTPNPWVPLRILGLGAAADAPVEADVYLLTDIEPTMLPAPLAPGIASEFPQEAHPGLILEQSASASRFLLEELRSDKGMKWLPSDEMWLTYLRLDARAGDLDYDLAIDASGAGQPSPVAAGLEPVAEPDPVRLRRVPGGAVDGGRDPASPSWWRDCSTGAGPAGPRSEHDPERARGGGAARARRRLLAGLGDAGRRTVEIEIHYSRFDPGAIDVRRGETVRFVIAEHATRSTTSSSSATRPSRTRTSSGPSRTTRLDPARSRSRRARPSRRRTRSTGAT